MPAHPRIRLDPRGTPDLLGDLGDLRGLAIRAISARGAGERSIWHESRDAGNRRDEAGRGGTRRTGGTRGTCLRRYPAAERAERPVILQISQNCVDYHGALEPIGWATLAIARRAAMPVAVHLDHAERPELVDEVFGLACRVIADPETGTPLVVPRRMPHSDHTAQGEPPS